MSGVSEWTRRSSLSASTRGSARQVHHQLSGGQLQRNPHRRALLLDIKLLIADEIISMIDASTRVDVLNLLSNLKTRGLGVLFVTHISPSQLHQRTPHHPAPWRGGRDGHDPEGVRQPPARVHEMLLTAVPQLHKKWEGELGAEIGGHGCHLAGPGPRTPRPLFEEQPSSLAGMRGRKGRRAQAVATERDLAAGLLRTDTYLRTHEEVSAASSRSRMTTSWRFLPGATTNRLLPGR